uniref:Deoxyuridine 5'-triphosphate nucleotidohydrolase n=1 Tax=Geotrypetes seraphini TaxID=260995 RepID=A0A6P8Q090_GEOSA|nr:probable deoxyuridine 5'-triphosphate nucleotidohydrolase [Geotrypetes seraphini]
MAKGKLWQPSGFPTFTQSLFLPESAPKQNSGQEGTIGFGSRSWGSSAPNEELKKMLETSQGLWWVALSDKAKAPTQAYGQAAGYDLYAAGEQKIPAGERAIVYRDIQVSPPPGSYLRIASWSGLASKAVDVAASVIDPDFRDNVGILLASNGTEPYQIQTGDCVAHMLCERIWPAKLEQWEQLLGTGRGVRGFGSSDAPDSNN